MNDERPWIKQYDCVWLYYFDFDNKDIIIRLVTLWDNHTAEGTQLVLGRSWSNWGTQQSSHFVLPFPASIPFSFMQLLTILYCDKLDAWKTDHGNKMIDEDPKRLREPKHHQRQPRTTMRLSWSRWRTKPRPLRIARWRHHEPPGRQVHLDVPGIQSRLLGALERKMS